MAFRIAQISDTHLSGAKPYFAANFLKVVNQISSGGADLVLNSGDMSLDGSAQESDLLEARRLHATLALPLRFIPGNHDIGESQDAPGSRGLPVLSATTRRRYLRHFGADYWCLQVPGWRILAIDDFLLGSDLAAADEQIRFVHEVASTAGQAALALFTHRPLFHLSPDEQEVSGRFVNPQPRGMLLAALGSAKPALIGSGHVHQSLARPLGQPPHLGTLDGLHSPGCEPAPLWLEANRLRRARAQSGWQSFFQTCQGSRARLAQHHRFPRRLRPIRRARQASI